MWKISAAIWWRVAGSKSRWELLLSPPEIGTITFMYFGELGYVSGFSCFIIGLLAMLAYMFVGRTGFIIVALRRHQVITIPEFYELRGWTSLGITIVII